MLRPIGHLRPAVYWRRRLLVLLGLVGVLGGGGWLGVAVLSGGGDQRPDTVMAGATADAPATPPALEQVVPALVAVQLPTAAPTTTPAAPTTTPAAPSGSQPPPGPVSGGPCTDDMIAVDVLPDPPSTPAGTKPTFTLVVTNVSPVACTRTLDKGQQEIVLLDATGNRVWGSNDCFPEAGSDLRTLEPGQAVAFPVLWSGLSSAPGCAGSRVTPGPGSYVLRGRLDTKTGTETAFTLT